MSVAERLSVCVDSSNSFILSFVKLLKLAQVGWVKKGPKVLIEDGLGALVSMPLTMLVVMPGWTSMSRLGCQQANSQAAVDPLHNWMM